MRNAFSRHLPWGACILIFALAYRLGAPRPGERDVAMRDAKRLSAEPRATSAPVGFSLSPPEARAGDAFAARSPQLALSLAEARSCDDHARHAALVAVVRQWAMRSPAEALAWCRQQEALWDGTGETGLLAVVLRAASGGDGGRITSLVQQELARPAQPGALGAAELVHAAIEFLLETSDPALASAAIEAWSRAGFSDQIGSATLMAVSARVAEESPAEALAWLRALPATSGRDEALGAAAALWTARDPAGALAWVEALPNDAMRAQLLPQVVTAWAQRDPIGAAERATTYEADPVADVLWAGLAARSTLAGAHPIAALRLAGLISDSVLRDASIAEVLVSWHAREPAAALEFIARSAWPPAEKTRLAQRLRPP